MVGEPRSRHPDINNCFSYHSQYSAHCSGRTGNEPEGAGRPSGAELPKWPRPHKRAVTVNDRECRSLEDCRQAKRQSAKKIVPHPIKKKPKPLPLPAAVTTTELREQEPEVQTLSPDHPQSYGKRASVFAFSVLDLPFYKAPIHSSFNPAAKPNQNNLRHINHDGPLVDGYSL